MFLLNLLSPHWISIDCFKPIFGVVVCEPNISSAQFLAEQNFTQKLQASKSCKPFFVFNGSHSFEFIQQIKPTENSIHKSCSKKHLYSASNITDQILEYIFKLLSATSSHTPLAQIVKRQNNIVLNKYIKEATETNFSHAEWFACYEPTAYPAALRHTVRCKQGGDISMMALCDGTDDCLFDNSDESICYCECKTASKYCKTINSSLTEFGHHCGPFYYRPRDKNEDCKLHLGSYSFQYQISQALSKENEYMFQCNCRKYIEHFLLNDLIPDCGPSGEDEYLLKSLLFNGKEMVCSALNKLPCEPGHLKCFNVSEICSFTISHQGTLQSCRNGGHLQECKAFRCNMRFKCVNSYCIQWTAVCNGRWDCPNGFDETSKICQFYSVQCKQMFKCKHSQIICISVLSICDGNDDWPFQEDEMHRELKKITCPFNCSCLGFAMKCSGINTHTLGTYTNLPFSFINIQMSYTPLIVDLFEKFPQVQFLIIAHSNVRVICKLKIPNQVKILDFAQNKLLSLHQNSFVQHSKILKLILAKNMIEILAAKSFHQLDALKILNLSSNPIKTLSKHFILRGNSSAELILDMQNVSLFVGAQSSFEKANLKALITRDNRLCCLVHAEVTCTAKSHWYNSCSDLLPEVSLKNSFGVFVFLVLVINLASIGLHFATLKCNTAFNCTVIVININDLQCAMYLASLWIADLVFAGSLFGKGQNGNQTYFALWTVLPYLLLLCLRN